MPKEFQKFGPNLRTGDTEILFRQRVEQLGVGLIIKAILCRPRYLARVEVVVGQIRLVGACLCYVIFDKMPCIIADAVFRV